jgi:hypothetical protein
MAGTKKNRPSRTGFWYCLQTSYQATEASTWLKVALGRITAFTLALSGW